MSSSSYSQGSRGQTSATDRTNVPVRFVRTTSEVDRFLQTPSHWNSTELLDFNILPKVFIDDDSVPPKYSKSFDYELVIKDREHFKRFLLVSIVLVLVVLALFSLVHFLPHKQKHHDHVKNFTIAVNQALTFFDAQKSGYYPGSSRVKFRASSGLEDGNLAMNAHLVGGFYDSGSNIKFTFPTAYTITLLSWSVIEYHEKYARIEELEHVKDIIRWGSDYLLHVLVHHKGTSRTILHSQVGGGSYGVKDNDISCWQRPEDMNYSRPVFSCDGTASDLAGEVVAALSAASLVLNDEIDYSNQLVNAAENLFKIATNEDLRHKQETYTTKDRHCGSEARNFYNSSGYIDELVWGGTWLFFATGNTSYLEYATRNFDDARRDEAISEKGVFFWNNKVPAMAVLLTRIRFFHDLGFPYEQGFQSASNMTDLLMCSYLSDSRTPGGLILLRPDNGAPLQYAATSSFLTKLYSDYLNLQQINGINCGINTFSLQTLRAFSLSQVNYILGNNPNKMSYLVGFGDQYPTQVHHRGASIPWDGQHYSCQQGDRWLKSKNPNPNILVGAMVSGPDQLDGFVDDRTKPWFTEPSIASNAGLVAALIAVRDFSSHSDNQINLGIDQIGFFDKVNSFPATP